MSKATSHQPSVLAIWWFVHPYMTGMFDEFVINDLVQPEGIAGFKPNAEHFDAMYAFGDRHTVDGRSSVLAVFQGPGDIVQVPPGWPHAVTNLEFCCKLAWDYIDTSHLSTYMVVFMCKFTIADCGQHTALHGKPNTFTETLGHCRCAEVS